MYDYLLSSSSRGQALNYIADDYRATRVVYSAESDTTQDEVAAAGREIASRYRMHAIATGQTVVFTAITDVIFNSAIESLILALIATAIFLVAIYWVLERCPSLGIANLIPIVWTIAILAGTMRYFNIPLNVLTATILSIAIGLGLTTPPTSSTGLPTSTTQPVTSTTPSIKRSAEQGERLLGAC